MKSLFCLIKICRSFISDCYWSIRRFHFHLFNRIPNHILFFEGGLGDQLLCTIPIRYLANSGKTVWFVTDYPEIFLLNKNIERLIKPDLARKLNLPINYLRYVEAPFVGPEISPKMHIIKILCNSLGIDEEFISYKPDLFLSVDELKKGEFAKGKILIQTSGISARYAISTKDWFIESYQEVVNGLADYEILQVGSLLDPKLEGVVDLRGKFSIREIASILHHASLFIGQVGFLMHLACAVDCPSVIIYGGREKAWQTGYNSNANIEIEINCSPCWLYNCNLGMLCMKLISPSLVIEAARQKLKENKN